jgi:hypothetical protein
MMHLEFGTAIHESLGVMYGDRDWSTDNLLKKAKSKLMQLFTLESVDLPDKTERLKKFSAMLNDGLIILDQYWAWKERLLSEGIDPVQFELPIKMELWQPDTKEKLPLPISLRLDCIAKDHTIVEFKTSSQLYDPFEARARAQSLSYVWAYYCKFGVIPKLSYVVMKKNNGVDRIQHLKFQYDISDIIIFEKRVRSILEKIKNRHFDRPLRNHPRYCDCHKFEQALTIN